MAEHPPSDIRVTTVRLGEALHQRVAAAAAADRRSFNNEVIVLLESALDAADLATADRDRGSAGHR